MKFSCTQENLNQGLNVVSHIAHRSASLPILNNVLIKIEEKTISLIATNLEIGVSYSLRGKAEVDGLVTVPARLFTDYVNLLPKEKINIAVENDILNVACSNYQTKINAQPASDFPLLPTLEKKTPLTVSVDELISGLKEALFAVSHSETRPEITGVLFKITPRELIIVATDSYRLAERKINLSKSLDEEREIIVPARTVQELLRILGGLGGEVEEILIYLTENQILFTCGQIELISRVIEGKYPDYQQIIPKGVDTKIIVNTDELMRVIKAASLFSKTGINDVNLECSDGELVVSSASSQAGENMVKLPVEIEGEKNSIVLNFRYFLDGLQNMDTKEVELEIVDKNTPCLLKPKGKKDYLYIVMPIKQ